MEAITEKKIIDRIVVHGGKFHADDVFCVAMALMCWPGAEVVRLNSIPEEYLTDDRTIVADIGFGKYDHHQPDAEEREDGSRYAACGLLFRDLKAIIFEGNNDAAIDFERKYIIPVEIADNGGRENPLSETISAFNATWDSDESSDEAFAEAVSFVMDLIKREKKNVRSEEKAAEIVRAALEASDSKIVELPGYMPWRKTLIPSTAEFVIYPSQRGGYNLQAVPAVYGDKTAKKYLPKEWITEKPEGCFFVHPALFLACFESKEKAIIESHRLLYHTNETD